MRINVKHLLGGLAIYLSPLVNQAQVTTIPANINPNDSVVIIVDLTLMDASIEHVQNLIDDADAGLDLYIWTWNPYEFPAGHPKVNGLGPQAWKQSNPALKMTPMGNSQYKFVFKPTLADWYETDAASAYTRGLSFLVKPQDGGGYGDPDRKSEDINVSIDPPATLREPAWIFPRTPEKEDVVTITYENFRETSDSLIGIAADDLFLYAEGVDENGVSYKGGVNYFTTPNFPERQVPYLGNGTFRIRFVPMVLLNIPADALIERWDFKLRRKAFLGGAEQVPYALGGDISCQ